MIRRLAFFIFLFGCHTAWGGETSLGEITVHPPMEGAGVSSAPGDATLFSTLITTEQTKNRRVSLPEVLSEGVGLQVKRYGGLDDFATVSIRGSTSEQVDLYVDGILLNRNEGGTVNLSTIPMEEIERIEVYRGAAPARFGSSSIGGVVNIITRRGKEPRETNVSGSYGSFQSWEVNLHQSQNFAREAYAVGYHFSDTAGDFTYLDDNGTPFNPNDDRTVKRQNNASTKQEASVRFEHRFEKLSLEVQDDFSHEGRGIPGLGTRQSTLANLETTRDGAHLKIASQGLSHLQLTATPFFQFFNQQFRDPNGEVSLGFQNNDNDTLQYGTNLSADTQLGSHQNLTTLVTYRGEQFLPTDYTKTPSGQPKSLRDETSVSLEDEINLLGEHLVFNPQIRFEQIFNRFPGSDVSYFPVSGKIGVLERPLSFLTLQTNLSRSYRIPDFTELFGNRGTIVGNANLSPEKGINWDIGTSLQWRPVRFEVAYFLNRLSNLIQFLQTSQFNVEAQNLSSARIQGIESSLAVAPVAWLDLSGNYTFQIATDTSGLPGLDGKRLPGRPEHEAHLQGTLHNRWGRLFTSLDFLDGNFLDTQNILKVNHRVFMGSGVAFTPFKFLNTSFEVKNILNDRASDVVGFPLPGRSYYGKVTLTI